MRGTAPVKFLLPTFTRNSWSGNAPLSFPCLCACVGVCRGDCLNYLLCISKCLPLFVPGFLILHRGPFGERLPVIWATMEQRGTSAGTPFRAHFLLSSSISMKAVDIMS